MIRWEYEKETIDVDSARGEYRKNGIFDEDLYLSARGEYGWELCTALVFSNFIKYYFKKQKT